MIRALYTAASGMSAQQMNLDTIANNLANSSTTGFRQLRLQFQDMVYQNLVTPGAAQSQSTVGAGLQIGLGTRPAATAEPEPEELPPLHCDGDHGLRPGPVRLAFAWR